MAENIGIARPYADAVFQLAREAQQLAGWSDALHAAAAAVADPDMQRLIDSPKTDSADIAGVIASVAAQVAGGGVDAGRLENTLKLLAENGRLAVLPEIAVLFDQAES